jgi:hypothetical protein
VPKVRPRSLFILPFQHINNPTIWCFVTDSIV